MRLSYLIFTAALLAQPATAQLPAGRIALSDEYKACMASGEAARGTLAAVQVCLGTEMALQEERHDEAYHVAMARQTAVGKIRLRADERQWRTNLTTLCAERASLDSTGRMVATQYNRCLLDETIARAAWLETYSPPE